MLSNPGGTIIIVLMYFLMAFSQLAVNLPVSQLPSNIVSTMQYGYWTLTLS